MANRSSQPDNPIDPEGGRPPPTAHANAARSAPNGRDRHANRILASLPLSELALLAPHLRVVTLDSRGAHGRSPDCVYFPHEGIVSLIAMTAEGATIEMASAGREGAIFPFVDSDLQDSLLVTPEPMHASRIAGDELRVILTETKELGRALIACREALLFQLGHNLVCSGLHRVDQRLPRWLLAAADRLGSDIIPATQESVGLRLGVRRTTITLVASKMQETGAVSWTRSRVEILDRAKLASAACSCYAALRQRTGVLLPPDMILTHKDFGT